MAYSRVRVQFEIGHEASLRNKKTPEGFTHDWEVFVRGADNTDIQYFVEKVVFHLHGTFPKPRRTFKEPPYCVKESGYAGFNLPIDIYLKNNNPDQRKLRFYYDLTLQDSGAPVSHLIREEADFTNPSEDFRRKLLMGGAVGVGSELEGSSGLEKTMQNHSSNSLHSDDAKISHVSKPKLSSSFGDSQKKHKSKDSSKSEEYRGSNSFAALFGAPIRTGKHSPKTSTSSSYVKTSSSSSELKTSSHEKQVKETSLKPPKHSPHKERDKEKESYVIKKEKDPDRPISKEKREGSHKEKDRSKDKPKRTSSPFLPTSAPKPESKKEEIKKEESPVKKQPEEFKEKVPTPKSEPKTEKKHKEKKSREERERKEHKEKEHKREEKEKKKIEVKEVKEVKEIKDVKPKLVEKEEKKKIEKEKEKERPHDKHKHKKKDKKKDEERERVKKKEEKPPPEVVKPSPVKVRSPSPPKIRPLSNPLNTLIEQMKDSDSDSEISVEDTQEPPRPVSPPLPKLPLKEERKPEIKEERKMRKEKRREDERERKRKRKLKEREEPSEKYIKMEIKERSPSVKRESRSPSSHRFTEDYVTQLKDLQHKIMTLQDNDDLQRVVQVISETGQFEITQRTFDFDLCALDRSVVKRLQDMFILS